MKLIHLTNLKRECVLVEWPEGLTLKEYINELGFPILLGRFPSITEQDFVRLVDSYHVGEDMDLVSHFAYKDYKNGIEEEDNVDYDYWDEYAFDSARESFISAIEAEGWYTENPYGKKPAMSDYDNYDHSYGGNVLSYEGSQEYYKALEDWQEAQEKVINLSNCYLFVKS